MTDTKRELIERIERAQKTSPQRRSGMWLWFLVVAAAAVAVVLAVVLL